MDIKTVRKILDPQFGYIAKSTGEPLYTHHFTVWSICKKLSSYVPSLDEKEKELLEIACLVHDIGKMNREIQEALKAGKKPSIPHKITSEDKLLEYFAKCDININGLDLKFILDIIRTHHGVSDRDLEEINTSGAGFFTLLLTTADWLASMDYVSFETLEKLKKVYRGKIDFTAVQCSRFYSPTYIQIINVLVRQYKEKEWEPICFPENGIVFIGKSNSELPKKEEVAEEVLSRVIKESLKLQSPIPARADRELLVSLAKYFPIEFLETHKDKIVNALGNVDNRGFVFLKYYNDLLKLTKESPKDDKIVQLLKKACGSAGNLKTQAKKEFKEMFGKDISNPKELLNELFNRLKLQEIFSDMQEKKEYLKDLKKEELYNILHILAQKAAPKELKEFLLNYLRAIILMEEEIDFSKLASEIFEKYKSYKRTSDAEKGACEICGCPVAYKMQPALNLSKAPQAFSQIKAKYAYRSICPFCAYDNLVLRGDVSQNKIRVYLKIKSKVPELFINYDEMRLLINKISSAIKNVRNIIKFKEREDFQNLPFPERIEVPIGAETKEEVIKEILRTEDSILFKLEDIREDDYSPKDMKVKYEPLYHIMKLLGFEVAIGAEEQEDLFGEKIETNEENYYKSLGTIILAYILGKSKEKSSKRYIFARNLLEKAPSITIRTIGDYAEDKHLPEGLIKCLIKGMIRAKIVIARR